MEIKDKFPYTAEGCLSAIEYLKRIGREDVLTHGFSTDGWSIVLAANDIYNIQNGIKQK